MLEVPIAAFYGPDKNKKLLEETIWQLKQHGHVILENSPHDHIVLSLLLDGVKPSDLSELPV